MPAMSGRQVDLEAIKYDSLREQDVQEAYELEVQAFPETEAATLETIQRRQRVAPDLFMCGWLGNELVGYVCGTATSSTAFTHEAMKHHETGPDARTIAIHSVITRNSYRRQGVASTLVREYVRRARAQNSSEKSPWDSVTLLSHEELVPLYVSLGFFFAGKSAVVHGPRDWYDMRLDLTRKPDAMSWEALTTMNTLKSICPLTSVPTIDKLTGEDNNKNSATIVCPCRHCCSTILKPGSATLVSHSSEQIGHPDVPPTRRPPDFPPSDSSSETQYWSIPSALTFENVGFSRNVGTVKYLSCADCECGPLGWHDTKGADLAGQVDQESKGQKTVQNEFLISAQRVRYIFS